MSRRRDLQEHLDKLERALARLDSALAADDHEIAVLVAMTVRTLLLTADHDLAAHPDAAASTRLTALRARATALLDRSPVHLRGAAAALRLLDRARRLRRSD